MDLNGHSFGQYRIVRLIERGGMARVYQGFQSNLDRDVAIKVIPARVDQAADHTFLDRFIAEARTVAKLSHPYIVPVYDFGVDSDWAYLIMEYITGGSMRDHLVRADQLGQRLDIPWMLLMLEQAAQALDGAHQRGVVHRDVKPANMLLRTPQFLLLTDFGVAKMLQDRTLDRSGETQVVGTPQYMAPEQCRADGRLDARCDIYSLGVVLYQCATGRLPFLGDSHEAVMFKQVKEMPPRPRALDPQIAPSVERIILTAMAKDPGQRYQRASDMAADLHAVRLELEPAQTGPVRQRASPTMPVTVPTPANALAAPAAPTPISPPVSPPQGRPGAPGVCFRCGTVNNPVNRYCIYCAYDLAAHRIVNDRFLASTGRPLHCRLIFRNGPFARRAFMLHQDVTTIGRGMGSDVLLQDQTISRQHARLTFMGGQWIIEDVNSSNGVFVNNKRIRRPLALAHGDLVRCGDVECVYELVS